MRIYARPAFNGFLTYLPHIGFAIGKGYAKTQGVEECPIFQGFYTQNYLVLNSPPSQGGAGGGFFFSILFKTTFVSAYFFVCIDFIMFEALVIEFYSFFLGNFHICPRIKFSIFFGKASPVTNLNARLCCLRVRLFKCLIPM